MGTDNKEELAKVYENRKFQEIISYKKRLSKEQLEFLNELEGAKGRHSALHSVFLNGFLPFADDDPKTAEIVTKVIMFAEDKKIKDVSILEKIK